MSVHFSIIVLNYVHMKICCQCNFRNLTLKKQTKSIYSITYIQLLISLDLICFYLRIFLKVFKTIFQFIHRLRPNLSIYLSIYLFICFLINLDR